MEHVKLIASSLVALFLLLAARWVLTDAKASPALTGSPAEPVIATASPAPAQTPVSVQTPLPTITPSARAIRVNSAGTIEEMDETAYLICVVAGEVSPLYHPEALKAQAVAARTYLYYKMNGGGCVGGGDICTA
ncbi:MAG: hypothetical protein J6X30_05720, partial [Clostridia bacterium]|nr:hypothetical protein [Clostridia bacterium]